jgi:hypothetical protein
VAVDARLHHDLLKTHHTDAHWDEGENDQAG